MSNEKSAEREVLRERVAKEMWAWDRDDYDYSWEANSAEYLRRADRILAILDESSAAPHSPD